MLCLMYRWEREYSLEMGVPTPVTKMLLSKSSKMIILVAKKKSRCIYKWRRGRTIITMHLELENIQVFVPLAHIYVCLCILYTQYIDYIYVIYIVYRLHMCIIYICCTWYNSKIAKSVISVGLMFIWLEECTSNSTIFQERAVIYVHRVRKRFINSMDTDGETGRLKNMNIYFCFHGLTDCSAALRLKHDPELSEPSAWSQKYSP